MSSALSRLPGELARSSLIALGGWLVAKGWMDESLLEPFVAIGAGVVSAVAGLAWSLFARRSAPSP